MSGILAAARTTFERLPLGGGGADALIYQKEFSPPQQPALRGQESRKRSWLPGGVRVPLRELDKLPGFRYDYNRVEYNILTITARDLTMSVGIRENYESYSPGQFIAYNLPHGAVHGCEVNLPVFAKQMQWVIDYVADVPHLVEEYHKRRADAKQYAADQAAG